MGSSSFPLLRTFRRTGFLCLLSVLLLWLLSSRPALASVVYLQGSANPTFNMRFTELLQEELGPATEIRPFSALPPSSGSSAPVITLGPGALNKVLEHKTPLSVLALLISEATLQGFQSDSHHSISAIFYDPPLLRQALIGRVILPQASRMALLARPDDARRYDSLIRSLKTFDIDARVFLVTGEDALIETLGRALSYGDFLLATPDEMIYNARTIKHILLTTYRRNRLVIGPGHAFVRAGVLASSFVPLPEYAAAAAQSIRYWANNDHLPPPFYPQAFGVEVNQQVARSLNLPLPDSQQIVKQVEQMLDQEDGAPDQ